jgi:hypothetical protein
VPVLSVLTAVRDVHGDYLAEAGASLAGQPLPPGWELEWVVQEDGDRPRLAGVVADLPFARHAAHGEAVGVAATRNLALSRVRGGLARVLDRDDVVLPGGLAVAVAAFEAHPHLHWVCDQADDLYPDGRRVPVPLVVPPGPVPPGTLTDLLTATSVDDHAYPPVHPAGLTVRTATVRALGGWAALPRSEDNSLLAALAALTPGYLTPEVTWLYRKHAGQTTRQERWSALDPVSWLAVHQRIDAFRELDVLERPPR